MENAQGREAPEGKNSSPVFVKELAKEGERLRKEVEFWEFTVEKLITMDWEIKKMREENEGLQKEVAGLRKEVATTHG